MLSEVQRVHQNIHSQTSQDRKLLCPWTDSFKRRLACRDQKSLRRESIYWLCGVPLLPCLCRISGCCSHAIALIQGRLRPPSFEVGWKFFQNRRLPDRSRGHSHEHSNSYRLRRKKRSKKSYRGCRWVPARWGTSETAASTQLHYHDLPKPRRQEALHHLWPVSLRLRLVIANDRHCLLIYDEDVTVLRQFVLISRCRDLRPPARLSSCRVHADHQ
jgi:hypothetical protein